MTAQCTHLDHVLPVAPRTPQGCEECLSGEPGEDWGWCYVDEALLEPAPRPLATA